MTAEEEIEELIDRNNRRMEQMEEMMDEARVYGQDERFARLNGKRQGFNMINQDLEIILENLQEKG